ncbi:hypothetical protein ACIQAC_31300 [Streptomyces sp. NPDC088387]|uniref:hypothetical protein n=1 Tax=Streptomyces sp. NPDC088387 TaxID=3365859 RepID=UPI003830216D
MAVGWCSRTLRAAVFAAVCVLLTALGHVMMSGTAVPWWAMAAAAVLTGAAAWGPAGRERGPVLVGCFAVVAQAVLHTSFALAQSVSTASYSAIATGSAASTAATGSTASMDHVTGVVHSAGAMQHMPSGHTLAHGTVGMSSAGMLAAHLLAALLCALWLAHGERAAFRILRALTGWLFAPMRLALRLPAPPHRPRVPVRRHGSDGPPRQLLLTYSLTSRGPPAGIAAV